MGQEDWEEVRRERLVKNEIAFRDHNDRRVAIEASDRDGLVPWTCECGDADCIRPLEATVDEFEAAHSAADHFIVLPQHVYADVEHVTERCDRYWVVEKDDGEMRHVTDSATS